MNPRIAVLVPLAAALVLAGCASTTSGSPAAGSGSGTPSGSSSAAAISTPQQLLAAIERTTATTRSTTFTQRSTTAGVVSSGTGAETFGGGKLTSAQLVERIPELTGTIEFRYVGGKAYAMLPASLRNGSKPWQVLSADSSSPIARELATIILPTLRQPLVTTETQYLRAATSVHKIGTATVAGRQVTEYRVVLDPSKLSTATPLGKAASTALGGKSLLYLLDLDSQDRLVRSGASFTVGGKTSSFTETVTGYDEPVSISAPPASQTSS